MTRLIDSAPQPVPLSPFSFRSGSRAGDGESASQKTGSIPGRGRSGAAIAGVSVMAASLVWSYWPVLAEMAERWSRDPRYSHGFLVSLFAGYVLWSRRSERPAAAPSPGLAMILLAAAGAIRLVGAFFFVSWLEAVSMLVALAGLCAILGGRAVLRWAWASIAFLVFMIPLPYRLETALGGPLQRFATVASSCVLQVLGVPAFSSGNTILIDDFQIGIIDACNGIGMSYMFLACSVGAALLLRSSILEFSILVASAIPIGLAANIARIVATGLLHLTVGRWLANAVYHDLAGWLMMLLAFFILWVECKVLPYLFIEQPPEAPLSSATIEATPASRAGSFTSTARPQVVPTLLAASMMMATGVVTGLWDHRWMTSDQLNLAVARLDRVPLTIGDWVAPNEHLDPRSLAAADLQGGVIRRYRNRRNGRTIAVMLVCGRPGPVAVHTPDICYPATGYKMAQPEPSKLILDSSPGSAESRFLSAGFTRDRSAISERLQIYWSWNAAGTWTVPQSARIEFAGRPFLYKLYAVATTTSEQEKTGLTWQTEFIRQLLPELEKATFPRQGEERVATPVTAASAWGITLKLRSAPGGLTSSQTTSQSAALPVPNSD